MKFTKGLIIGGILTAAAMLMYNEGKINNKSMMKTGKKIMKKVGII